MIIMFLLGGVFKIEDLTGLEWAISILIGLGSLPWSAATKLFVRCARRRLHAPQHLGQP